MRSTAAKTLSIRLFFQYRSRHQHVRLALRCGWPLEQRTVARQLLLVQAADVSGSVDESKFDLQRSGYAAAFSNPRVIEAIRTGPNGRIAVAFIEWSGILQQKTVIDWTSATMRWHGQFGDHIMETPRAFARNSTGRARRPSPFLRQRHRQSRLPKAQCSHSRCRSPNPLSRQISPPRAYRA